MNFPLTIHLGNSPRGLTTALVHELEQLGSHDPMRPLWIAVGQRGMERAVKTQLTEAWGVSANLRILKPMMMLTNIANAVVRGPELLELSQEEIGAALDAILWPIFAELKEKRVYDPTIDDVYQPLRQWFARACGEPDPSAGRTLMQLAMQLRRVYLQYQADRPQWHEWWVHGHSSSPFARAEYRDERDVPAELRWQVPLWQKVREIGDPFIPSPVDLARQVREAAEADKARVRDEVRGLHIFGVTKLTELQRELIDALRTVLPIWLYVASPTSAYWTDVRRDQAKAENVSPLLPRFGHHSRYLHDQLTELAERGETHEASHFEPPAPDTLLRYLQHQAISPETFERNTPPNDDDSIAFHRSHGPMRQVEVLHDLILERLDKDPTLEPCDIAVLCPNLPDFAPFIDAIFRTNSPAIPFRVEDQSVEVANPVADALLRVASLVGKRVSPREIVELLNAPVIRARFQISAEEVPALTQWLRNLDVRWGWNTASRAENGRPGETLSTWEAAIQRLALGAVFDADHVDAGAVVLPPFDDDHAGNLDLARRLVHLLRTLFDIIREFEKTQTIGEWTRFLIGSKDAETPNVDVLTRLVELPHGAAFLRDEVYRELALMQKEAELSGLNEQTLDGTALNAWLQDTFSQAKSRRDRRGNAVSFAELKADRFVENRVTFLLGMDDGSFPRPTQLPSWDLRQFSPRPNDSSPRDEDLYAMLQAFLLTKDHFGVLWQGTDTTTNQALPPALPVLELQRIIAGECADGDATIHRMTTDHRLHPFSQQAFIPQDDAHRPPFTYNAQWARAAAQSLAAGKRDERPFVHPDLTLASKAPARCDAAALARALLNPLRTFLNEGAGIQVDAATVELHNDDLDVQDALEAAGARTTRMREFARAVATGEPFTEKLSPTMLLRMRAKGAIRPGLLGEDEASLHARTLVHFMRFAPAPKIAVPRFYSVNVAGTTYHCKRGYEGEGALIHFAAQSRLFDALTEPWAQLCIEAVETQAPAQGYVVAPLLRNCAATFHMRVEAQSAQQWLNFAHDLRTKIYQSPTPIPFAWKHGLDDFINDWALFPTLADFLSAAPANPPPPELAAAIKKREAAEYGERRLERRLFGDEHVWFSPLGKGETLSDDTSRVTWESFRELYAPLFSHTQIVEEAGR